MKPTQIKVRWAFAAVLAIFPFTGLICALTYKDISMFYWALAGAAVAALVFPLVFFLMPVLSTYLAGAFAGLLLGIHRFFTRK
jgi:hypothetical protein